MKSKFEIKDNRPYSEKLKSFGQSLLFWRGRSKGIIHTRNIKLDDFRYIFFPKGFEKYGYLGTQIWNEDGSYFKALYPLVLALDYEAKPKLCPRWFLRFLHVFGMDKSIVRVRNHRLSNLLSTLTKGIGFIDYKTKWRDYDLRISISAPKHLQELAAVIESGFYSRGRQTELVKQIKAIDPEASITWGSVSRFEKQLEELEKQLEDGRRN
tara:strand:- start:181 stop:810 length:630 start_codon:yes stop_codon:yes gene_type:complete